MALVLNPTTGRYVEDGRPAQPRANPNAINVGQAAADVVLGGLSTPGAALADLARYRSAQALGGDMSTLEGGVNPRLDAATGRVSQGLSQLGQATGQLFGGVQTSLLGAFGATPAQTQVVPDAVQPQASQPAAASPSNAATPMPTTTADVRAPRTAADLAGINEGLAYNVANTQTPAQRPMERGNYNVANTSNVDAQGGVTSRLPQPVNTIEGGYGGFGGGRGTEYLNQMRTQDAVAAAQRKADQRQLSRDLERSRLEQVAAGRGGATERRAARQGLAALNAQEGLETQESGSTLRAGLQADTELQRALLVGQVGLQQANLQAQGGIQQAEITGQYGLAGREATAQAKLAVERAKGQSGAELKAQAEAIRQVRLQALADEAGNAGDVAARDRYLGVSQPTASRLTQDALGNVVAVDGRPVTAQEAQAFLQALGYYKTPTQ